jgi:hypothetical protein
MLQRLQEILHEDHVSEVLALPRVIQRLKILEHVLCAKLDLGQQDSTHHDRRLLMLSYRSIRARKCPLYRASKRRLLFTSYQ